MSTVIDPVVARWLEDGPREGPPAGLQRTLSAARAVNQRSAWTYPRRWLPGPVADVRPHAPRFAVVGLLLLLMLLLLLAFASFFAASSDRIRNYLGPAANGLIAFSDGNTVDVIHVDGTGRRTISRSGDIARTPLFSPDGSSVAYVATTGPGALDGRLIVVPVDGGAGFEVSGQLEVTANRLPNFAWSRDSSRIAFAGDEGGPSRIYVVRRDGTNVTAITDDQMDRDLPAWSTNGEWITFRAVNLDGGRRHLQRARPDGTEMVEIDQVIGPDTGYSRVNWSPNGDELSFTVNTGFGTQTRAVIDLGFGHVAELWTEEVGGYPGHDVPWSPNGALLAILTADHGLVVAESTTHAPYEGVRRMLGDVVDCWVGWAPDNSALYGGSPDGCQQLVIVPLNQPRAATTLPISISGPASWQAIEP